MTKQQKITLSASRDIPFNKLMLSQSNVRHVKAGVSIEELAEDIARRTLLASITVRPVLDDNGAETGMFTIPAGGRRFRALELLVKQKRMNKTALVPCVVRMDGLAEEDSLAENIQRAPLHPLDQFRAFQAMREKGRTEEEIAAAFFVSASVVKQRLKLAAVAPALHDVYAEEEMTLDQLMAFTVNPDHARQEQVWEALQRHYSKQPYEIRRMLTEGAVRASDKRAQFVGLDNYVEAGGDILRDLFQQDDGGWLQDASLLDVMVTEKLAEEAAVIRSEGWKWVEVDTGFPYGHTFGMRRIHGEAEPMSDAEAADYQALKAEYDTLEAEHAEADELPEEVDARLGEIETAMEALQDRPIRFEAEDLTLAGAFVSIDSSGRLRVERGYVRSEDEPVEENEDVGDVAPEGTTVDDAEDTVAPAAEDEEEEDGLKPLSDRLVMELTAHRTLALRNALAQDPQVAYLATLHAMTLRLFYRYGLDSCVEIEPRNAAFGSQVPGLGDTSYAQAIDQRHETWARNLPKASEDLWEALTEFDSCSRETLFAHCVAMSVNAVHDPYQRRPRAIAHADVLAGTIGLDMAKAGWAVTGFTIAVWIGPWSFSILQLPLPPTLNQIQHQRRPMMTFNPDPRVKARKLTTALLAAALAVTPILTTPAQAFLFGAAGRIVYDPQKHAENILSAARSLEQINNQITQLQNQAQMLMNEALNLASLPHSSLGQLQSALGETQRLLTEAASLAFDVATIEAAFAEDYGTAAAQGDFDAMIGVARDRWEASVTGFEDALRIQAGVVGNIDGARTEIAALVRESQGATGALQVAQAGNQLMALQSAQLADLTAAIAAQNSAVSLEAARVASAEAQGRENLARFLDYGSGYAPGATRLFRD